MSKKVLIIRSTVVTKDSQMLQDARAIAESITNSGVVMLPANYTYEFGEIDSVIWEGEKKEEKKPSVNLKEVIDIVRSTKFDDELFNPFREGYNTALTNIELMLLNNYGGKEKTNEEK